MWEKCSVAPMLDVTDRHFRYFVRLINKDVRLYSEMVVAKAILRGNPQKFLRYNAIEHPLALQIGTDSYSEAKQCTAIAIEYGYDEINLNVGCPSDRVKSGSFGACLMLHPEKTAEIASALVMNNISASVKCRIGVTGKDSFEELVHFIDLLQKAGIQKVILHARIAILKGLNPKENRTIPPLKYDVVYQIKKLFPKMIIELNGGITTLPEIQNHLTQTDRVMIGRATMDNPMLLCVAPIEEHVLIRKQIAEEMISYSEKEIHAGARPRMVYKAMLGLFNGQPGARTFRAGITSPLADKLPPTEILNFHEYLYG